MATLEQYKVRGLQLPQAFVEILKQGRWNHPGDKVLLELIPFLREPVDFLNLEAMHRESPQNLTDDSAVAMVYHVARGSKNKESIDLPWLDAELAVFVAVNRFGGDDLAIVLDYRTGNTDPRVVASDWGDGAGGCLWREVAPTLSSFCRLLGM